MKQAAENYPVEVLTGGYENAHGKKPRGEGNWAFSLGSNESLENLFWFNGPYGAAVKAARVAAREKGERFVRVQS